MGHKTAQVPVLRFLLKRQRRIILIKIALIFKKNPEGNPEKKPTVWINLVIPQKKLSFF